VSGVEPLTPGCKKIKAKIPSQCAFNEDYSQGVYLKIAGYAQKLLGAHFGWSWGQNMA